MAVAEKIIEEKVVRRVETIEVPEEMRVDQ
jgi:hypothetical protein